ncbi:MAG: hypothetical protein HC824_20025 [Synechococcales cyanobacterium RM1_1_8]|nr:hypothetical protein [Synechococcales cyanobacterium RM1_1_8]
MSIFEGIGLDALDLDSLGIEWWAIAALLFVLPKLGALLLGLLFMFAEKVPGFETFAGGRVKAFRDRLNGQVQANSQKLLHLLRLSK